MVQLVLSQSKYGNLKDSSSNKVIESYNKIKCYRFGNFRENFIFANSIKRHISDVKYLRLRQDLLISIHDRGNLPLREGCICTKLRIYAKFRENKVLAKISKFTVTSLIVKVLSISLNMYFGFSKELSH